MKILRLDLKRFGPFTDHSLDLSDGQEGLHVVYGANEAGKSSSLRALHQLFYGFPVRSNDNFLHPYPDLRVGALLRGGDGSLLECIRRKAKDNTLRAEDDETVLDESRLAALLGGLDEEAFRRRYGINYEQLVAGGKDIVAGHGDLGQSLFAAGAGVADLRGVQQRLEAEAGDLFKLNAKLPRINSLLSQWKSRHAEARQLRLSTSEWKKHDEALRDAIARQERLRGESHRLQAERERLGRIRDAMPLIATLRRLEAELAELRDVPLLADDFSQRRAEAQSRLTAAIADAADAQSELETVEREIGELEIPTSLLNQAEQIARQYEELGAVRKAQRDLPRLEIELAEVETELRELLKKLGRPQLDLADLEQLRLPSAEVRGIQELAERRAAVESAVEQADRQVARLEQRLENLREQLAASPEPADGQPLREALRQAERVAELEPRLRELENSMAALVEDSDAQLAALGLWRGTLDEAIRLAVPEVETCDRWNEQLHAAETQVSESQAQLDEERRRLTDLARRIEEIRLAQDVPTEDDLSAARRQRDHGWSLVRRAWLEGEMNEEFVRPFAGEFASAGDLADAFDRCLRRADDTVDRLRREAERVAEKTRLLTERRFCEERIEQLERELQTAESQLARQREAWRAVWLPLQIEPRDPREMRSWLRKHEAIVTLDRNLRQSRQQRDDLRRRLADAEQRLAGQLDAAIDADSSGAPALAALLEAARKRLDDVEQAANLHDRLSEQVRQTEAELVEARRQCSDASTALADWQRRWAPAASKLGLSDEASSAQVNVVVELRGELLARRKEADKLRERIKGIRRDAESFAEHVRRLAAGVAPELADSEPAAAAEQLQRRLAEAREADARRAEQRQRQDREAKRRRKAQRTAEEMNERLTGLCREAGCASPEQLPEAEQRSRQKRELDADFQSTLKQVESLSAGAAVAEFRAAVEACDPDEVAASLAVLADDLARLEQENDELQQTIGSQRTLLAQMDGSAKAAEAESEAQFLLAEIRARAEDYARLRLATAVLAGAIERYREKHQGPILQRASELFAELTLGSFAGLRAEFGEGSKPELVGLRPTGQTVSVLGMSEGTCDQLFLALRLASLEHDVSRREPVPLIVDDIMIMFDDDRSAAALKALARLSEKTQVILFTHHEHLVQLARAVLTDDVLFVHNLGACAGDVVEAVVETGASN